MLNCLAAAAAGVYINGYRPVDAAVYGSDHRLMTHGDIFVAEHPFSLTSSSPACVLKPHTQRDQSR